MLRSGRILRGRIVGSIRQEKTRLLRVKTDFGEIVVPQKEVKKKVVDRKKGGVFRIREVRVVSWRGQVEKRPASGGDDWRQHRVGFRVDWAARESTDLMVQTALYDGVSGSRLTIPQVTAPFARTFVDDSEFSGGYLLGRLTHRFSETSEAS